MKVLFIGGTGLISSACTTRALQSGIDLHLLTRGQRPLDFLPPGSPHPTIISADIRDPQAAAAALAPHRRAGGFDCVVNFVAFDAEDVARDIDLFAGTTRHYILISSCVVYEKPPSHYLVDERTPLSNPFWSYAQRKIAAENALTAALRERGFPATIVRPSHTYSETRIPAAYHNSAHSWTTAWRLLDHRPVIIHGDGTSLWQLTHAADFARGLVGLLGRTDAVGEAFHITSDEVLTWNQILATLAELLRTPPNFIHIPSDFIARHDPERGAGLLGDKAHSVVFDNAKIKRFVPSFAAAIPLRTGLTRTLDWFRADPARQTIDPAFNTLADQIIAAYERAV